MIIFEYVDQWWRKNFASSPCGVPFQQSHCGFYVDTAIGSHGETNYNAIEANGIKVSYDSFFRHCVAPHEDVSIFLSEMWGGDVSENTTISVGCVTSLLINPLKEIQFISIMIFVELFFSLVVPTLWKGPSSHSDVIRSSSLTLEPGSSDESSSPPQTTPGSPSHGSASPQNSSGPSSSSSSVDSGSFFFSKGKGKRKRKRKKKKKKEREEKRKEAKKKKREGILTLFYFVVF